VSLYRKEIYPVYYHHSRVEDNEKLKQLILPFVAGTMDRAKTPPDGWLTNHLITSFENDEINKEFFLENEMSQELHGQYREVLKSFFDMDYDAEIVNLWYNCYENGEYQESHRHLGNPLEPIHFACVHFLSYNPEIHQPLVFTDPLTVYRNMGLDEFYHEEKHRVVAKEGDLIMFPSWLEHEVKAGPPTPDYPRITLSFNIKMHRYGEHGKNQSIG
jgi:hypothetical protein